MIYIELYRTKPCIVFEYFSTQEIDKMMSTSLSSSQQLVIEQQQQSANVILDTTKDNIRKTTDEVIRQNSHYTEAIKDVQQLSIQVAEEMVDNYFEIQKNIINVIKPVWDTQTERWNNWTSPGRVAEISSKMFGDYADNTIAFNKLFNNIIAANMNTYLLSSIKQTSNYAKGLSEMGLKLQKYSNHHI